MNKLLLLLAVPALFSATLLAMVEARPSVTLAAPPDYAEQFRQLNEKTYPLVPAPPAKPPGPSSVRVPILVYHSVMPHHPGQTAQQIDYDVDPVIFDRQLRYLKDNGYTVVSLEALYQRLANDAPLPDKSVVINFDDGWDNQYVYAAPILEKYGDTATFFIYSDAIGRKKFMTWPQVLDLQARGMAIGGHTRKHPLLTKITDQARLYDEIVASKQVLEQRLGGSVDLFAYPFGAYDAAALAMVKQAGYHAARIFQGGPWNDRSDLFTLRSVKVTDNFAQFESYLTGVAQKK